jgi:hypothetical protein
VSNNRPFYTTINLKRAEGKSFIIARIWEGGRFEVLYEQFRGPLRLLRWDNGYVPSGHSLAMFTEEDAFDYVMYENDPKREND